MKLYLLEASLQSRIREIDQAVREKTEGRVQYEEMVALPYHGLIVLRFQLDQETVSLKELDAYETLMRETAGKDFLCDFMGDVYQKAGVSYDGLEEKLAAFADRYAEEEVAPSCHYEKLCHDGESLLRTAGLDPAMRVWEIQVDEDRLVLLILGNRNRKILEREQPVRLYVGETAEKPCLGLVRAACYAAHRHISLARLLKDQ